MATPTDTIMAKWNKPHSVKAFYGITLGYFESRNIHTNEMAILEAIVDLTHKSFVFLPHLGDEAENMKSQIDQTLTAPSKSSYAILWTGVKEGQWFHKNLLYNLLLFPNYRLALNIGELWQLCLEYNKDYNDKPFPKLPNQWKSKLKWLEQECKSAIDWLRSDDYRA